MQYQAEYGSFIKEKAHYSSNKPRVYAYLCTSAQLRLRKCTSAMQNAIRMDPLFNSYEQARDPVRLWRRISDISMNGTGLPENEAKKMENARFRFDKITQKSTETVGEFYERFVQNYDAMTSQGSYLYNVIIPPGLPPAQALLIHTQQRLQEEALKAMSFIKKLDSTRFKDMRDELDNAYEFGRDEYPRDLTAALTMASRRKLNGHLVDGQMKDRADLQGAAFVVAKSGRPDRGSPQQKGKGMTCWFCDEEGHTRGPACKKLQKEAIFFQKNPPDDFMKKVKESHVTVNITGLEEIILTGGDSLPFGVDDLNIDNQASLSLFHNRRVLTHKSIRSWKGRISR
jgi:hypothetical protein